MSSKVYKIGSMMTDGQRTVSTQWLLVSVWVSEIPSKEYRDEIHVFTSCPTCGDLLWDEPITLEEWIGYRDSNAILSCDECIDVGYKVDYRDCFAVVHQVHGLSPYKWLPFIQDVIDDTILKWSDLFCLRAGTDQTEPVSARADQVKYAQPTLF